MSLFGKKERFPRADMTGHYSAEHMAEFTAHERLLAEHVMGFEYRLIEMGLMHGAGPGDSGLTEEGVVALASLLTAASASLWDGMGKKDQAACTAVGQLFSHYAREVLEKHLAENTDGQHRS